MKAAERTAELIAHIQPNPLSEERRKMVSDYVQRLVKKCFSCQVCTFGSVPLKTYLPDGDIDVTAFSHDQNLKDTWANQVRDMLENEEKNQNAEFHVKEVQYIHAKVLYRFLEVFSNFDWDNFCVSFWGPVPISSLPDVTVEPPLKDRGELLLSKLFLGACSSMYAVFPGGQENNGQPFVSKHFNVIDPLRVNNNLGRSVSKGNFFRICSAFGYGAKRLAILLNCPKENLLY
ncbi:Polynucleotide adenylyltransferase [Olea europaea subsp. europaea]|uniref:Polynucleotide adenylyltransferase n=1 Tax=Olea europaea subsp. europaea TaxID=158383 RepID=A0A8S0TSW8_OLEEU|nr:Polynucleotide adenylyltransferase [Olea europaea subsp. europaea]